MRFSKILRFGRTRTNVCIELSNMFNSNTPTTYEANYDPANPTRWFQPTAVVLPRFVRFNAQFDFGWRDAAGSACSQRRPGNVDSVVRLRRRRPQRSRPQPRRYLTGSV